MKKFHFSALLFFATLFTSVAAHAQSWNLTGNSGTKAANFLGTTDNKSLIIKTNNLERMRINNQGFIGIGATSPAALLEIKGKDYNSALRINYSNGLGAGLYFDGQKDWSLMSTNTGSTIGIGNLAFYNVQKTSYPFYIDSSDNTLFNWQSSQRKYGKMNVYNNADFSSIGVFAQGQLAGIAGYAGSYDSTQHKVLDYEIKKTKVNTINTDFFGVYGESDGSSHYSPYDTYVGVFGICTSKSQTYGAGVEGQYIGDYGFGIEGAAGYYLSGGESGEARAYGFIGGRYNLNDPQTHTTTLLTTGVYGKVIDTIGENRYAVYADGNLALIGNMYTLSDERMKTDIKPMQNALSIINRLQPKTFQFIKPGEGYNFPKEKQYGMLAQDVQKILPELVQQTAIPKSMKGGRPGLNINDKPAKEGKEVNLLNYQAFIPLLIKAAQELSIENDSIKTINTDLQTQLNNVNTQLTDINTQLINVNKELNLLTQLMQSHNIDVSAVTQKNTPASPTTLSVTPNPAKGNAVISYSLPSTINKAEIIITNTSGVTIKKFTVNTPGKGQLSLNTGSFANGNYNCSLYINGALTSSRQIIVTK